LVALAIHFMVCVLVGLLYGAMLPIFPRRSLLTAGLIAPLLWSALAYTMMKNVSPLLSGRMNWWWFVLSQVAYGLVAGAVIHLRVKVRSAEFQALPFATRAGLHTDAKIGKDEGPR
jgi:DMSO/TMAO reductase YedYZ heme-binding membrane subunit